MEQTPAADVLVRRLRAMVPPSVVEAIDRIVLNGPAEGGVFAVGGTVRDLVLGRQPVDIDLSIEADAIALARVALPDSRIKAHTRFGTASVMVSGVRIDLATARTERYPRKGALPRTEPAGIIDDLIRRDFTMNTIALRIDARRLLIDPLAGLEDIADGLVRVFHDSSFLDDPTRIFRAYRYAARLAFLVERHTVDLLHDALPYIARVSGERLRREFELIFGEETGGTALEALHTVGALQAVHPALHWNVAKTRAFANTAVPALPRVAYGFALLAAGATGEEASAIAARLRLRRAEAEAVSGVAALRRAGEMLRRPNLKPSGAVVLLDRHTPASLAAFALTTGNAIAREITLRYLDEWRAAKPILSGRDLIEMGIPAGPHVQQGLQLVRAARLDGWATDRDDERALILRFAKSIRDSDAMTSTIEMERDDE